MTPSTPRQTIAVPTSYQPIAALSREAFLSHIDVGNRVGSYDAALILQQVHYWCRAAEERGGGAWLDGVTFVRKTYQDYQDAFPALSFMTIRRRIDALEQHKLLVVLRPRNAGNLYRVDYAAFDAIMNEPSNVARRPTSDVDRDAPQASADMEAAMVEAILGVQNEQPGAQNEQPGGATPRQTITVPPGYQPIAALSREAFLSHIDVGNRVGSYDAALILQQVHYWCRAAEEGGGGAWLDGVTFVRETYQDYQDAFPALSFRTIRRRIDALEQHKLLVVLRPRNTGNLYRVDYAAFDAIMNEPSNVARRPTSDVDRDAPQASADMEAVMMGAISGVQNEQPGVQNEQPGVQNEQPGVQNEQPGVQNEQPGVQNEQPGVQNEQPGVQNEQPGVQNEQPDVQNEQPAGQNEQPDEATPPRPPPGTTPPIPPPPPPHPPTQPPGGGWAGARAHARQDTEDDTPFTRVLAVDGWLAEDIAPVAKEEKNSGGRCPVEWGDRLLRAIRVGDIDNKVGFAVNWVRREVKRADAQAARPIVPEQPAQPIVITRPASGRWHEVLERLREGLSRPIFDTWLAGTVELGWGADETLVVGVPAEYVATQLHERLGGLIEREAGCAVAFEASPDGAGLQEWAMTTREAVRSGPDERGIASWDS